MEMESRDNQAVLSHNAYSQSGETLAYDISSYIKPNSLNFGLICDVADVNTAQRVMAPLRQLPPLVVCHVWLNPQSQQCS